MASFSPETEVRLPLNSCILAYFQQLLSPIPGVEWEWPGRLEGGPLIAGYLRHVRCGRRCPHGGFEVVIIWESPAFVRRAIPWRQQELVGVHEGLTRMGPGNATPCTSNSRVQDGPQNRNSAHVATSERWVSNLRSSAQTDYSSSPPFSQGAKLRQAYYLRVLLHVTGATSCYICIPCVSPAHALCQQDGH
eukprot:7308848-Pyramimonas_sp.AAC.2